MGVETFAAGAVYLCEEVSEITFTEGLVFLTDRCGDIEIKRAMRLSTFSRCVRGAYDLLRDIEQQQRDNILRLRGAS